MLLCQAGKDYLVSNAAEDEFIAKLPQGIKKVYPDSKHEIFNADDDTLEKFYSDILDFGLEHENEIRQVKNVT